MKLISIDDRIFNDLFCTFECEHCSHKMKAYGYNDANFFDNVIPNALCPICDKSASGETSKRQLERLGRTYELIKMK